ncbi:hypothetical protein SDJN02_03550, partial [Cucurbita argyrosperma subsp. argyrosperma]
MLKLRRKTLEFDGVVKADGGPNARPSSRSPSVVLSRFDKIPRLRIVSALAVSSVCRLAMGGVLALRMRVLAVALAVSASWEEP